MLKARVSYVGQSEHGKEDRFAVVESPVAEQGKVEVILDNSGYKYEAFGDSYDAVYYVQVDDKDDYNAFMEYWKEAKKAYNAANSTTKKGANTLDERNNYAAWEYEKASELDNNTLRNYIWQLNNNMSVPYAITTDLAFRDVLWNRGELPYGYHEKRLPKEVYDRYVPVDFRNKYLLAVDEFDEKTGQTTTTSIEQLFVKDHGWVDNEEYDELVETSGVDATSFYNDNVTHISAHYIDADGKPSTGNMPINVYRLMCDRTYDPINKEEYDRYKAKYAEWLQKREKENLGVPGVTAEYKGFNINYIDHMDSYHVSDKKGRTVAYTETLDEAKEGINEYHKKESTNTLLSKPINDAVFDLEVAESDLASTPEIELLDSHLAEYEESDERNYKKIKSKTVEDSDGFNTEYTMYYDKSGNKFIFIFGDSDVYDPHNSDPDWECDSIKEAEEWFNNYSGFADTTPDLTEHNKLNR